jgi:hypothetical protein
MESAMLRIYRSFGIEMPPGAVQALANDLAGESVDFGRLDEELQESVIRKLSGDPQEKRRIQEMNPMLEKLMELKGDDDLIEANRRAIEKQYGRQRIAELLLQMYQSVMEKPVCQKISKTALLNLYLDPRRLFLVGISDG